MLLWIAALSVCVVALLAIPIDFGFDFERRDTFRGRVSVAWLFGAARFSIPSRRAAKEPPKPKPEKRKRKRKSGMARRILKVIRMSAFRRRVLRLMTDLFRSLYFRNTRLHVWAGFDDPADTGLLCAWVVPFLAILRQHTSADLLLYPDFEEERFEASGRGEIRVVPLDLLGIVVFFMLSPSTLRAGWTMVAPART